MSNILISGADIITLDSGGRVLRQADVAIADTMIVAVGAIPADFIPDETVAARGQILAPGFFNAHTHSPMTLLRGWGVDLPLDRWLNERIKPAESALSAEDVFWGAGLAAVEMIRSGTVGFADHYFYMDQVAQVALDAGLRANLAWCVFGGEQGEVGADLSGIADFVEHWQGTGGGRIKTVLGPHSPITCSPLFLARTAAVAARLGVGIHIHLAESAAQVADSLARYDLTPVELLNRNGVLDVPVLATPGIYLSEHDNAILAAKDVTIVQCPTGHMKLGLGVTPILDLLAQGIQVALGTDGPASSHTLDMLGEARQAALLQKLQHQSAEQMPGDLALRLATSHGARALGFPLSGQIAAGHNADLILFDGRAPRLHPRHNLVANVLYGAQSADISDVMVAGHWLMRGRSLLTLDEERILFEAERRGARLVAADHRPLRADSHAN